ncbi:MAG TPA: hypothetical protein VNM38_03695, partial [Solirubrobacterales bacterium]|nr:hypothetical protein [Solirubrobacterales bacterium]
VESEKIVLTAGGTETTAAGAAQFALESKVIPRIEEDLAGKAPNLADLPFSIRLQNLDSAERVSRA